MLLTTLELVGAAHVLMLGGYIHHVPHILAHKAYDCSATYLLLCVEKKKENNVGTLHQAEPDSLWVV